MFDKTKAQGGALRVQGRHDESVGSRAAETPARVSRCTACRQTFAANRVGPLPKVCHTCTRYAVALTRVRQAARALDFEAISPAGRIAREHIDHALEELAHLLATR